MDCHALKKLLLTAFITAMFAAVCFSQTTPTRFETDFQLWNETQFIIPLNKKKDVSFVITALGRLGNNAQKVVDARIGGMITKKFNKYVTVGGGYLYRYSNPTFLRKRYESRYIGVITFTAPLGKKFTLINRNQVQYENRYSRLNATVLRTRLWLKREVTIGKIKIEPFISSELFYDTRLKTIARYRTQIGFSRKFNPKFSADFFYVRQNETGNHSRPGTLDGIGTNFRFNF
jgi:Protein of unknown function (DUF2490)